MNGQLTSKIKIPKSQVELINLIFAELEITFHNQFHKAFPDEETLTLAKQLWLAKLEKYQNEIVFRAIDKIIETSKYLPSLSAVLNQIKELKLLEQNIPSSNAAYIEASSLGETNPLDFNWSHPFVYHAGAKVGWYRLKTESEFGIKKEFLETYEEVLEESEFKESLLLLPKTKEEVTEEKPLSSDLQKDRLEKIKKKYL
ncbi:MAG: hypothetical protein ISQ63_02465 [SAR86 cluster bacterium]|uniref:Replicative helicase inhibitor G39P N-terminal domain-containing protein n=1 Tax=SAR86 cluster bacterium TaxID=2030880 RepID=A0A937LGM7_9GAMM|nr:hypothetical protein [Gammaproteobacteria bacterium]MBL6811730.1 hypothetical protein [SAR86 cluster bacterium]